VGKGGEDTVSPKGGIFCVRRWQEVALRELPGGWKGSTPLVGVIYLSLWSENNPTDLLLCNMRCIFSLATSRVNSFSHRMYMVLLTV